MMTDILPANKTELAKSHGIALKIYIGLITAAIILVVVGWVVSSNVENSVTPDALFSLKVGVLFIAVFTFVLRRILMRWERLRGIHILNGISGLLHSLKINAIVLGILALIVSGIGFLIATLGGIKTDMLTFGAISLILFFINFPRKRIWVKVILNLENV